MGFDWDDLRYFLLVARTGRLTLAAKHMGTDHATISRRIKALEEALDTQLFNRSPRGYSLTGAGEKLLMRAEAMENSAALIQDEVTGEKQALSGTVRVGAPDGFGAYFLAPRIGQLTQLNPQLELQLIAMPRIFSLSKREADVVIGLARPDRGRLFSRRLTKYTLHLYGARSYLDKVGQFTSNRDVARHPVIGYIQELIFTPKLDYLKEIGEQLAPHLSSSNIFAQLAATAAGAGLCILPDFMAASNPDLVQVLPNQIELRREFWITAHQNDQDSARIQAVIEFIASEVKSSKDLFWAPYTSQTE